MPHVHVSIILIILNVLMVEPGIGKNLNRDNIARYSVYKYLLWNLNIIYTQRDSLATFPVGV